MKHIIICREYPPPPYPSGGIGTYVFHISQLLAERGETLHVIAQLWEGAPKKLEEKCDGRLIIHRVPMDNLESFLKKDQISDASFKQLKGLYNSSFPPQCFSWQAGLLAEKLIEEEGIDIIEGQDYEAPLYYFQIRRALGLGPKRKPPCIVHLHSPTEFIALHNEWDINHPYFRTAKRLEDYSIAAADTLLCPSRYFANQAEIHYGLTRRSINVIPLPIGDSPRLERDNHRWERGKIFYMGRLERRKGIIEWIDAAVSVAYEYPEAQFEFVGANCLDTYEMSGEELVAQRIPKELKGRFHFWGEQKRSSLPHFLARARIAVVPSRWENFPNTCVEAMCSGLPVIASREGGMVEMIEDGVTGWLSNKSGREGLEEALKRALQTPPLKIAEMGREASLAIHQICNNEKIVEDHLRFRTKAVNKESNRSLHLPVNLPWNKTPLSEKPERSTSQNNSQDSLAIVITCSNDGKFLEECLSSLKRQTRQPSAVLIVNDGSTENHTIVALNHVQQEGWQVIHKRTKGLASARNSGIETILNSGLNPVGFTFLSVRDRLQTGFVAICESILRKCPEIGLISGWIRHPEIDGRIWIRPCPSFPYQWLSNELASFSVVRTEALREAGNFRPLINQENGNWDLFNAVMAAGWVAITVPDILGDHWFGKDSMQSHRNGHAYAGIYRELLERFSDLIALDAKDIVLLAQSDKMWMQEELLAQGERLALAKARILLKHPRKTALHILRKVKNKVQWQTPIWISKFIFRV